MLVLVEMPHQFELGAARADHEDLAGTVIAAACQPAAAAEGTAAGYVMTPPAEHLAAVVGRLAWRLHQRGHTGPPASLAPEYVRRPDVEIERDRKRAAGLAG